MGEGLFEAQNLSFDMEKLAMVVGRSLHGEWKDLPVELLLRIISLLDDRTVLVVAGVCTEWRKAIFFGLTRISLSWCNSNMNTLVQFLIPKYVNLQTLILRQNKAQVSDEAVEAVAAQCHDLRHLDLSKSLKLTDRALFALAQGCPRLVKLNISGCSAFTDNALAYLVSRCTNLKDLNLCGCTSAASDVALQAIAFHCDKLQSLNLGWCEDVGDVGVTSLAKNCPDLRALDLCGCVSITDDSVVALANGCPHLRSLGLYYCQNITDKAMYSLANSLRAGKHRHHLWRSSSLRSSGNSSTSSDEEGLMNLNISQCTSLTPPAVQAVCNSFPSLHTCSERHSLIISGCLNLTSVHCACAVQARAAGRTVIAGYH